jgi:hypothetical protein
VQFAIRSTPVCVTTKTGINASITQTNNNLEPHRAERSKTSQFDCVKQTCCGLILLKKEYPNDEKHDQNSLCGPAGRCRCAGIAHSKEAPMTNFLDELLAEVEEKQLQKKIELDQLKADQLLMAVAKLESQMDDVNKLADDELKLIEQYRQAEIERLEKKRSWLLFNLEGFWRQQSEQTGEKTLRLPHGSLALRKGRDKVEIENMAIFLKIAPRNGWLRTTPEKHEPDLQAIAAHIKATGEIPLGTKLIPGGISFSYQITKGNGNGTER